MKQTLLFLLILVAFSGRVWAQEADSIAKPDFYRNSIYVELLGNGFLGSVNYERMFKPAFNYRITLRVGGSYFSLVESDYRKSSINEFSILAPLEATILTGKGNMNFETGLGITIAYNIEAKYDAGIQDYKSENYTFVLPAFRIGGRWQPVNKPYFMRMGVVIMVDETQYYVPSSVFPWLGLSFGYSFGKKKN